MEHNESVRDLWFTAKRKTGQRTRTRRYGVGRRWQVNETDLEGKRTSEAFDTREEKYLFDASVKVKKSVGTLISSEKKDVRLKTSGKPGETPWATSPNPTTPAANPCGASTSTQHEGDDKSPKSKTIRSQPGLPGSPPSKASNPVLLRGRWGRSSVARSRT